MVYDRARQRIVMTGGCVNSICTVTLSDIWEWDGNDWTQIVGQSLQAIGHAMAYDETRGLVVMHGAPRLGDTWLYGQTTAASARSRGVGCAGGSGVPQIART